MVVFLRNTVFGWLVGGASRTYAVCGRKPLWLEVEELGLWTTGDLEKYALRKSVFFRVAKMLQG